MPSSEPFTSGLFDIACFIFVVPGIASDSHKEVQQSRESVSVWNWKQLNEMLKSFELQASISYL